MGKKAKISAVGLKLICSVMLIVLLVLRLLIMLVRQEVMKLSKEELALQSQTGAKAVGVWAERIWYHEGLARNYFGFGEPYVDVMTGDLSVSAGAAFVPEKVEVEELYQQTDDALYETKRNGKNGFMFANRVS